MRKHGETKTKRIIVYDLSARNTYICKYLVRITVKADFVSMTSKIKSNQFLTRENSIDTG